MSDDTKKPSQLPPRVIAAALMGAMQRRPVLPKDGENKAQSYDYTKSETVFRVLPPHLAEHGLALFALDSEVRIVGTLSVYVVTYELHHPASGEFWRFTRSLPIARAATRPDPDKGGLACDTTMLAYTYRGLLSVERAEEVDNQSQPGAHGMGTAPRSQGAPRTAPPRQGAPKATHGGARAPQGTAGAFREEKIDQFTDEQHAAGIQALEEAGYEAKEIDYIFEDVIKSGKWGGKRFVEVPLKVAVESAEWCRYKADKPNEKMARKYEGVAIYKRAAKGFTKPPAEGGDTSFPPAEDENYGGV